jgi:predicted dehydrogenase
MLRLGMVGGGRGLIGRVHANGARLSGRWDLVAAALSSDPDVAQATGADWHLPPDRCYADYAGMARAESARPDGIDAVAIVTPNHLHAPVAQVFLSHGIDVISDKPLTARLDEAQALARDHAGTDAVFAVTYVYASHAMVRQAREMVLAGDLGEIRQVHVEYFQQGMLARGDAAADAAWRLDPARSGPSLTVADIGTHAFHLAEFAAATRVTDLRAECHVAGAPKTLEDTAHAWLRLEGGATGTLMVSQAMAGEACGLRLRIGGTKASLAWDAEAPERLHHRPVDGPERILTRGHGGGMKPAVERLVRMPRGHPEALSDAWANLYLEAAVAVAARRDGTTLPSGLIGLPRLADGLRGMRFVDAVMRSHDTGARVALD